MSEHTHNNNCVLLSDARGLAQAITGKVYSEKWIYTIKELKPFWRGKKMGYCINRLIFEDFCWSKAIVPHSKLKKQLRIAQSHKIKQTDIASYSGISYSRIYQYANGGRKLHYLNYKLIVDAINILINEKDERNEL
jgi:hypothetical protein